MNVDEFKVVCTECKYEHIIDKEAMYQLDNGGSCRCPNCLTLLSTRKPNKSRLKHLALLAAVFVSVIFIVLSNLFNLAFNSNIPVLIISCVIFVCLGMTVLMTKTKGVGEKNISHTC
ncbi:hypothetical protein SAMN04488136_13518 [Vibrio xiamenensis]|uniref:Cxxc_20_cxxc protein n=1 Tax=Vibrio xiamenensis TaxID=861298 RepID=A0A1G8G7W8_9VIBR|nr:hypothetical protein [Vibrio xiamenensis]SDH90499.1 hypothetical protein SAMN04488136_13518 [Vibrio xiamenensis]